MDRRTTGIIATIATALLCGCPGLLICLSGFLVAIGAPIPTALNQTTNTQSYPSTVGFVLLCLSVILIAIPIVVGFVMLRNKPSVQPPANNEPLPPAS